jgi:xanthine dehydrogenase YagR molybdenum-binding subunit
MVTSAITPATASAVNQATTRLLNIAAMTPESPFHGSRPDALTVAEGRIVLKQGQPQVVGAAFHGNADAAAKGLPFEEVLRMADLSTVMGSGKNVPSFEDPKAQGYSLHSFGAHFAEVEWSRRLRGCA